MKRILCASLTSLILLVQAFGQTTNPAAKKIPRKWLAGLKGYQEAAELQKQTGSDMIVYFADYGANSQKGLCHWWESDGMQSGPVKKVLEQFIKVKIELPLNSREEEAFARFRLNKAPAVFVVRAEDGDFPDRVHLFDWQMKRPKLKEPEELSKLISERSSSSGPAGSERDEESEPEEP